MKQRGTANFEKLQLVRGGYGCPEPSGTASSSRTFSRLYRLVALGMVHEADRPEGSATSFS